MATPYLQLWAEEVASTQDLARAELEHLPVVVAAQRQTTGRGRGGAPWLSAPRALAVSLAFRPADEDLRPFSLMAGLAAVRCLEGVSLKWPNDLIAARAKVGGILVERADETVIGMGVNLWWPEAPEGMGALRDTDPGPELHARVAGLWAAELMRLIDTDDWPIDEYRSLCTTLGKEISWEPDGRGTAVDITSDGALVVESSGERRTLTSGAIRHVRH
jgi:BirA family transcriptional regulator, biotin operon repressor / biotin---[acetyl-CoA-carboxylase] ligase